MTRSRRSTPRSGPTRPRWLESRRRPDHRGSRFGAAPTRRPNTGGTALNVDRRRRLLLSAALLALAVAVLLAWRPWATGLRDVGQETSESEPAAAGDAAPPTLAAMAGGPVGATKDAKPAEASSGVAPSPEPAPARPTLHIRGHVRMPSAAVPDGAVVYVAGRIGTSTRYLARGKPAPDGVFELEAPAPDGDGPWGVAVGVWVPGRPRVEVNQTVKEGVPLEVDLAFPEGARFAGHVLDEDNKPVADLRVAIV